MKAAVVQKDGRSIKVQEVSDPEVEPGELLLKTIYCSICGTDLEYLDGVLANVPGFEPYSGTILGHEWVAEVVALGEGVQGWSVGDRAARCSAKRTCGVCYFCRRGLYHLCVGGLSRGSVFGTESFGERMGTMAEYFLRMPNLAQPVAENLSSEEACLAEPLATGIGSVRASGAGFGDSVVIIGAGKVGLGAMLCARAAGVAPVIIIDINERRLKKALELGADIVLNPNDTDVVNEVVRVTDAGPDAVLICVREGKVLNQAVQMVRRGGTIVLTGFVSPMGIAPALWVEKQLTVRGSWGGPVTSALNLMAHSIVDVRPLITHILPLEDVQKGIDLVRSGEGLGVLLKP